MRSSLAVPVVLFAVVFSPTVSAQCKDSIVGTWKLVSTTATTEKGDVNKAVLGQHLSGLLTYTADGRMMAIISDDGRKPLSVADRVSAPAEERAQAYSTSTNGYRASIGFCRRHTAGSGIWTSAVLRSSALTAKLANTYRTSMTAAEMFPNMKSLSTVIP
jgi:hypothetical protein